MFGNGSASNAVVTSGQQLWGLYVAYQHDIHLLESNLPEKQTVGNDSFRFKVLDTHLNFSMPATVSITVVSGVSAVENENRWQCYEDMDCEVQLYGTAADDSQGEMLFTITAVPSYGSLFDANTYAAVNVGSELSRSVAYPYENGAGMIYRPLLNFFTDPTVQWNGTQLPAMPGVEAVSFYTSIEMGNATISSSEGTQELMVTNVNDNSTIICPESLLEVRGTKTLDDIGDDRPDRIYMSNLTITEKDQGVDAVRVDVGVLTGFISLNDTYLARLSFDLYCGGTHKWTCTADGRADRRMVFIGAPEDVQGALKGMEYYNFNANSVDTMTITLYDGFESDCIWEFPTTSVRVSCASSTCSIMFNVTSAYVNWYGDDDLIPVAWYYLLLLIMWCGACIASVFRCIIKALCFCCCYRRRRKLRHREVRSGRSARVGGGVNQEVTMPTALKATTHTPARVPLGRQNKNSAYAGHELMARELNDRHPTPGTQRRFFSGLKALRRYQLRINRNAIAATQDFTQSHTTQAKSSCLEPAPNPTWGEEE